MPSRKTTPKPTPKAPTAAPPAQPPAQPPAPDPTTPDGGEAVLAEAATTAVPNVQPTVDPQPPEVASTTTVLHTQATDPWRPIYDLEVARALPECHPDLAIPGEAPANERQIQAFKDTDGRTMVLGLDPAGRMVKVEARQP